MAKDVLERAEKLFYRRKYGEVISILEPVVLETSSGDVLYAYKQSFELYFFLGMSCLYTGDTGGAWSYFDRAKRIKPRNTALMLAHAVVAIMQGKVPDACGYYLEILRRDPDNRKATKALEFLRKSNDETIRRFVAEKKIFRFCPNLKKSIKKPVLIAVAAALLLAAAPAVSFLANGSESITYERADLSEFNLSQDERGAATEQEGFYNYVLTSRQVISSYESIKTYFNSFRDNAAQVEINRLLNSNASSSIRRKARMLMDYLSEPGFDTISDVYPYSQVAAEPLLYMDCWVVWDGMAANIVRGENSTEFSFLVGYNRSSDLEGVVQVNFSRALSFDQERPFTLLGQIKSEDGRIVLRGSSMYQSVRPAS